MSVESALSKVSTESLQEIQVLVDASRQRVAIMVNTELSMLYWHIGGVLKQHLGIENRAAYGKQLVERLAKALTEQYGRGWSQQQLRHSLHLVETFPDQNILYTLCRELNWSKFRPLMYIDDAVKRQFYAEMTQVEGWSVR